MWSASKQCCLGGTSKWVDSPFILQTDVTPPQHADDDSEMLKAAGDRVPAAPLIPLTSPSKLPELQISIPAKLSPANLGPASASVPVLRRASGNHEGLTPVAASRRTALLAAGNPFPAL